MKPKTNSLAVDPKLVEEISDEDAAMVNGGAAMLNIGTAWSDDDDREYGGGISAGAIAGVVVGA